MDDPFLDISDMAKPPSIVVSLSISPFTCVNDHFLYLGAPMLSAYIFTNVLFSSGIYPLIIM